MESDTQQLGRLFFSAYGRIGRKDFWLAWLALFAINLLFGWFPFVGIVAIYCTICIYSKRLHDMGRSGWLQVIPIIAKVSAAILTGYIAIAIVLAAVGARQGDVPEIGAAFGFAAGGVVVVTAIIIAFLVELAFLLWIGISGSDPADNIYGSRTTDPVTD